ncbi:hypothetical protein ACFLZZ_02395 [Nanoarchaeota archaeon]
MNFEHEKKQFLSKRDRSPIGEIDKDILPLCNLINSKKDYYTNSSCSGRILLMKELGKKIENAFLFTTHNKTSFKEVKRALSKIKVTDPVYFKHEPCIMHITCRDIKDAFKIVNIARNVGWKRSGVFTKRNCVELISTEVIRTPVMDKGKILVEDSYLDLLVKQANIKLTQTRKKISNLTEELKVLSNK